MIKKIISGGQTGADRAALDLAIKMNLPHGGWIPKGRITENGPLPDNYQLKEMATESYAKRTEQNVKDSDGTLIITHGNLTGGSAYTRKMAVHHCRPWLHIDLNQTSVFKSIASIHSWVEKNNIEILNVAGPRASGDSKIYHAVTEIIEAVIYMDRIGTDRFKSFRKPPPKPKETDTSRFPKTVSDAVEQLISELPLKDKVMIANMTFGELFSLHFSLGKYIRSRFGLWAGNQDLMAACRLISEKDDLTEDEASSFIVMKLWEKLKKTHKMRLLK